MDALTEQQFRFFFANFVVKLMLVSSVSLLSHTIVCFQPAAGCPPFSGTVVVGSNPRPLIKQDKGLKQMIVCRA
jgi:hypothetical protein